MTVLETITTYLCQSGMYESMFNNGGWNHRIYNPEHTHWFIGVTNIISLFWIFLVAFIVTKEEVDDQKDDLEKIGCILIGIFVTILISILFIIIAPIALIVYLISIFLQIYLILMSPHKYTKYLKIFKRKKKQLTPVEQYKQQLLNIKN